MTSERDLIICDSKKREVVMPDFGDALIVDTHAHLDMLEDPVLALARAARSGVGLIATLINVDENFYNTQKNLESWKEQAAELLAEAGFEAKLPEVLFIAGTHPHEASSYSADSEARIRLLLSDPRCVGIGEVGLDFFYNHSPQEQQVKVFESQLALAIETNTPVCLHIRDAHDEAREILRNVGRPEAGIILHCFNLGPEVLEKFLEFDPYVSFAGPLTFKKAEEVRESAKLVPLDRLLTETDCPFMAPEPLRGQKCEPAYTAFTAARLAEVRDMKLEDLASQTLANAKRCFGLSEKA